MANGGGKTPDRFLVCGLGSLGQYCVALLKDFGVWVTAIDTVEPIAWEIETLPDAVEIGDCRDKRILDAANIRNCRAILLVTPSDRTNLETALQARVLNPQIRLVVRSSKQNLNHLLARELGNFVGFDPHQLPAPAFALAALGNETLGFFKLDEQWLQVVRRQVRPGDRWIGRPLRELNRRSRRLLAHGSKRTGDTPEASLCERADRCHPLFYQWNPNAIVREGDTLIYIETMARIETRSREIPIARPFWEQWRGQTWRDWRDNLAQFWRRNLQHQVRRVAIAASLTIAILLVWGTVLFRLAFPNWSLAEALNVTAILLLGGYPELFGDIQTSLSVPWGLQLFGLGLTLAGTAFVGVLYALAIEYLLSARLDFLKRRRPIPHRNHAILVGFNPIGSHTIALLQEFRQPLVCVVDRPFDSERLPPIPTVVGKLHEALTQVNLSRARSVIAISNDRMENLEVALMAHQVNPEIHLVIHTLDMRFGENVAHVLPRAHVLCASSLAAEAFVGAAFGENIEHLFRFDGRTVLVTEYTIEAGDTLMGLILAEIAYGYGVVPILWQRSPQGEAQLMPSDDSRLHCGDRLVVLATMEGLRAIERGELEPRSVGVWVKSALTPDAAFEGAQTIARISGCNIGTARSLMENLPGRLAVLLYYPQALRLVRHLRRIQVEAEIEVD
jgi:Trk K+ transport system NAD-binding subunit